MNRDKTFSSLPGSVPYYHQHTGINVEPGITYKLKMVHLYIYPLKMVIFQYFPIKNGDFP
jgi:hypothetical protein